MSPKMSPNFLHEKAVDCKIDMATKFELTDFNHERGDPHF